MEIVSVKRRQLLLGVSVVASGLSGCLGNLTGRGNGIEYERCALPYVPIIDLPSPAKEEANGAIENEAYETDGKPVLSEVISIDESYLIESRERGWRYYDMTVTTDDGVTRLHGEEIRPKETSLPTVENKMETDATVDIRVEFEDEVVFEDTLTFAARTETDLDEGTAYRYGHYEATLTISTGTETREEVVTWTNNHVHGTKGIAISADDVRTIGTGWAGEIECEWNDEGKLVSGPNQS